ncbi:hypothetical protein C8Q78DRAFT_1039658 [Trametes maxima]|nr:hypothetical protein C8Q78DRAFT_1039658 [Trametes maxima]
MRHFGNVLWRSCHYAVPQCPRVPVLTSVKLFWERVTFSRLTKIYFVFSVFHCIVQVIFQVQAFIANAQAAKFLYGLVEQGNATEAGFAVYNVDLRMCDTVPRAIDASSCTVVWDGHTKANNTMFASGSNYAAMSGMSSSSAASSASSSTTSSSALISTSVASSSSNATASTSSALASQSSASSSVAVSSSSSASSALSSSVRSSTTASPTSFTLSAATLTRDSTTSAAASTSLSASANATRTLTVTVRVSKPSATPKKTDDDDSDSDSDSDDDEDHSHLFEDIRPGVDLVLVHDDDAKTHSRRDAVLRETQIRLALNGTATVNLNGLHGLHDVQLPRKCLYTLNWPVDSVENTKREDVAFIAFQIWLLGMSLVALLNESIPHVIASMLTHILATAWGGFQIYNTEVFHKRFTNLTTEGSCGINLLPNYWKERSNAEIPSLALNVFALLVSSFLSWRLMKSFGWQTFKRVGASRVINRVYNLVLMLSIAIQLSLFFVGASAALWIDQVYNGNIGRLTMQPTAFKAVMITVLILLVPWLSIGWISVRKELRIPMTFFLAVAGLVLVGWASMFIAATFRWTYVTWLFFSLMTTAALLLTVITLILGIVCYINFGKGLTRYLNAEEELPDDDYHTPGEKGDAEKVAFPSNDVPIPTFSVAFGGAGREVPLPSQMFAPRQMGPRFYSGSSEGSGENPFMTPVDGNTTRSGSPTSYTLSRHSSRSSQHSQSSVESSSSLKSKRWVIE